MNHRIAAVLLLALSMQPAAVDACSGPEPPSVLEGYKDADIVVLVQALEVSERPVETPYGTAPQQAVRWSVLETWKGHYGPGDSVETLNYPSSMCSFRVMEREPYILYLKGPEPYRLGAYGSRSDHLMRAIKDAKELYLLRDRADGI